MIVLERGAQCFSYRAVGVVLHEKRVLLHRSEQDDFWSLPGGRVELLEAAGDALKREAQEELGVEAAVERLLWVAENFFEYAGKTCHELGLYFLVHFPASCGLYGRAEAFRGQEGDSSLIFQWHDVGALEQVVLYPTFLREALQAIPETVVHVVHQGRPAPPPPA